MRARKLLAVCAAGSLAAGAALAQQGTPQSPPGQTLPGWGGPPVSPPGQAASPGGLVAIAPQAVVTTYYAVRPVDMTASNLMRTEVYNPQGERIGRIEDLVIGGGRDLVAVVVGVGGFLGLGERYAALPPSAVVLTRQADGSMRALVNATRDELRNSPEFKFEGNVGR